MHLVASAFHPNTQLHVFRYDHSEFITLSRLTNIVGGAHGFELCREIIEILRLLGKSFRQRPLFLTNGSHLLRQ